MDDAHLKVPLRHYTWLLVRYLRTQRLAVLLLTILLLTSIALQLLNPLILRAFLDTAEAGGDVSDLVRYALIFLAVAVAHQLVALGAVYFSQNVGWRATNALRADLVEHCLGLDLSFHNAHTPGEMIERIDGDVNALTTFFSQFVIQVLGNAILLAGILVLLYRLQPLLGLVMTLFCTAALLLLGRFRDIAVPHWKAERQASAELFGFLEERLGGTEDLRANGGERYVIRRFFELTRVLLRQAIRASQAFNVLFNLSFFLFAVGTAAAFAAGAWLFQRELITLGTVYVVFYYTNMLEEPIQAINRQMETLQRAGAGLVRVRDLLGTSTRIADPPAPLALPSGGLGVEFRGVSFGYHDQPAGDADERHREMVLHDLSLTLAPGTVLGLLGRTGSGKTTLTRLLFRLYDPDRGQVCLIPQAHQVPQACLVAQACLGEGAAAVDVRQVPLAVLRRRVAMVTQNVQLFHASLRDNLTFFDRSIPDERILGALDELGIGEWVQALPRGLDTPLESGGGGLSAGEAQLLAFTRILLRDPGLVILDEASSRLDPATEQRIDRAVERLVRGRTAIIVAHRLATVQRADEILILEAGAIGEHGRRAALAADPGSQFHRLLEAGLEEVLA